MKQLNLFQDVVEETSEETSEEYLISDLDEVADSDTTKVCRICHKEKSIDNFHLDRGSPYSKCKECFSDYQKSLRNAKKTAPDKPEKCECCGKIPEKWVCDHYPGTDIFRGWVCSNCNLAAGYVDDSYEGAVKLVNYLYQRK